MNEGPVPPTTQQVGGAIPAPETCGKAKASLALGILAAFCCAFSGIPAIILGVLGLLEIDASAGRLKGKGIAETGIALGLLFSILVTLGVMQLVSHGHQESRMNGNAHMSRASLRIIGDAALDYHQKHQVFPEAIRQQDDRPPSSWRVTLLPYLNDDYEVDGLAEKYDPTASWDSPANADVTNAKEPVFHYRTKWEDPPFTSFFAVVGEGFIFDPNGPTTIDDIKDGPSNTILFVEYLDADVPWTQPKDLSFEEYAAHLSDPRVARYRFFYVVMADGSAFALRPDIPKDVLHALFTINGGEQVDLTKWIVPGPGRL